MTMDRAKLRAGFGSLALGCLALACAAADTRSAATSLGLERTRWTLTALGAAAAPIAKTQTEAFLLFGEPPGRVSGSGGCNRLAGSYERKGDELHFGPIAGTRMFCAEGMPVEDALGSALGQTTSLRIEGHRLELRDASGALLATFQGRAAD
ncbi:MAG: META domain-containing protein [Myxococcota bacterium]